VLSDHLSEWFRTLCYLIARHIGQAVPRLFLTSENKLRRQVERPFTVEGINLDNELACVNSNQYDPSLVFKCGDEVPARRQLHLLAGAANKARLGDL